MSRYGLAIQERRELVGYNKQRDLARAVKALKEAGELPAELDSFSQQWLSGLEQDRDGSTIASATPKLIRALSYMLEWSSAEFEAHVGIAIPRVPKFDDRPAQGKAQASAPAYQPAKISDYPQKPIPAALVQAASEYGKRAEWADLREYRWQRWLTDLHHRRTPQTPEEWLNLFIKMRQEFDPPEEDSGSTN